MINPMLRDQALLEFFNQKLSTEDFILYFYKWDMRSLSLGKIQRNSSEIINEAKEKAMPLIKRPSGGKSVIHGEDICFTFITKQSNKDFGGSLLESYAKVMKFIIKFLNDFFAKHYNWQTRIELKKQDCKRDTEKSNKANCFSNSINCEGIIKLKNQDIKILGAAQTMFAQSFLQQASLIVNNKSDILDAKKTKLRRGFNFTY